MSDTIPTSLPDALQHLRSQPGIDLRRQIAGSVILVETSQFIYELEVVIPASRLVRVNTTDKRLDPNTIGKFKRSIYGHDDRVSLDDWIGQSMKLEIQFNNGILLTGAAISASISRTHWHYLVF